MLSIPDDDLLESLEVLESDRVVRKESLGGDAPKKIRQAICAFANDLPDHRKPGVVLVGVRDDGTLSGLTITDELLLQLADMKSDGNIVPPLTMAVEKRTIRGSDVAVAIVAPSDAPPVRFKGQIWIRTGPRREIASAQDERILNEKRRYKDRPFDARPVREATILEFGRERFENEYLPSAIAPEALAANDRTFEQRLAAAKMIASVDDPVPTVLGLLVLAPRVRDFVPGAFVQFLRVDGESLADEIVDERAIDGPLTDIIRRLDEKVDAHNRVSVDITSSSREERRSAYPTAAIQQILRNAIMHRTYEGTGAPVRVTWYNDRIEVTSPGGPYGLVRRENFGQPGVADYRNPNLAEAMKVLGYVQRFGVGLATAKKLMAESGHPEIEFDVQPTLVGVTMRARR